MPRSQIAIIAAAIAAAVLLAAIGDAFVAGLGARMAIFALVAVSLQLVVGVMGFPSFGHAAFFGIGAYTVGILARAGIGEAFVAWPAAMLAGGVAGIAIGAVALRTRDLSFIFITLAFGQMVYFFAHSLRSLGADDGFALAHPNVIAGVASLGDPRVTLLASAALLGLTMAAASRLARSVLGRAIRAARDDELRLAASGLNPYGPRLAVFAIAAAFSALGGALLANLIGYISPSLMSWVVSGEMLMMVILGGPLSLVGAALGGAAFVLLEQLLSDLTEHWMLLFGILLVARVLLADLRLPRRLVGAAS
jgi:branched-chain amino acid transport system permease protein